MTVQSAQKLTQAERTEKSDQRMFEATVSLLNERGTAQTRLSEVGLAAGYSRGLAGHRFGNKENLFAFVVRQVGEIWLAQLKDAVGNSVGLQAVENAVDQHFRFCAEAPDHVRAFYSLWFESINAQSELSQTIKSIHQRRFQDVVNWILNDPDIDDRVKKQADLIAAQFSASIVGIVYYWLANPEKMNETNNLHEGLKVTMKQFIEG